ncbi:MAG: hypothetical protein HDS14_03020 [Bacteroides sp.]|nr:hypothetical protein [Bacteroides sp.]
MKYIVEDSLQNFKFWSGGKDRADNCSASELDSIEEFLEEIEPVDGWTDTAINDVFWFDFDTLAQHLGYKNEEDFDLQHDPNYLNDDDLEEFIEEWFVNFLQGIKEREGTDGMVSLYENCFSGDYMDFALTDEEKEEAEDVFDYPDWIGERIYNHLLTVEAADLMEALFEDDNGHENLENFPTKEQFRKEMMCKHKKSEQQ